MFVTNPPCVPYQLPCNPSLHPQAAFVHPRLVHFGDKGVKDDPRPRLFVDLQVEGEPYDEGTENATFPLQQLVPGDVPCLSEEFARRFIFPPSA